MLNFTLNEIRLLLQIIQELPDKHDYDNDELDSVYNKLEEMDSNHSDAEELIEKAPYALTENQKMFVQTAIAQEFEINWSYSGRGMFGKKCPAVVGQSFSSLSKFCQDNMGKDIVFYAKDWKK